MPNMNMTHPDILMVEKYGYVTPPVKAKVIGRCTQCNEEITDEYEYYESKDGLFCCDDCLYAYYEIIKIG